MLTGELALQNIVWQVAATVVFGIFGSFDRWPGWLGLGIAVLSWAGLVRLAVVGHQAGRIVSASLGSAEPPLLAVPVPPKPEWGRWWRITRAIPFHARGVR